MFFIRQEELLGALLQLKQALYNHEQWHKDLIRSLVCRLPCDPRDTTGDAHLHCRFGQWYYTAAPEIVREHAAFTAMEMEHKNMHALAARLLLSFEHAGSVATADYDSFANALEKLRLQLHSLIGEIEDSLYKLDPLTGAESRIGLLAALRQIHALIKRAAQACSVAILDLDRFKDINDSHGHIIGDHVLSAVVRYVKTCLRPYDRIFRYGGEEFLISLPNTDLQTAQAVMERIREGLAGQVLTHDGDTPILVTASFGIAPLEAAVSIEESIDRADRALYAAKQAGRNRVQVWGQ
ncbi:MAG: diguanylate cyclase [Gammaproteobacteria bacterium]|nr:diguanylate cyclase [Gammaproteobacteria bacterium]